MDPCTIIGAIAATGQLIGGISKTVNGLMTLRGRIEGADRTIQGLIGELKTVKFALSRIQVWAKNNERDAEATDDEFQNQFTITKDNVELAMQDLEAEVVKLVNDVERPSVSFMVRARCVWNEDMMRAHKDRLHDAVFLLQRTLLEQPGNKEMLRKVSDDTSTLRSRSVGSPTVSEIGSRRTSTVENVLRSGRNEIQAATVARPLATRSSPRIELTRENLAALNLEGPTPRESAPQLPLFDFSERDSAVGTSIQSLTETEASRDRLTPLGLSPRGRPKENVPARSISSAPPQVRHKWSLPAIHVFASSDSAIPQLQPASGKSKSLQLQSKWKFLSLVRSESRSKGSEDRTSPTPTMRRGRRRGGSEGNARTSIDFGSPDGLSAPETVRAAQAGSVREIEELLEHGADIDEVHRPTGRTPLSVAAHCGNDDVVAFLLQRNAQPDILDNDQMTPLHLAASRGHYRVVELLLEEQVDVDATGPERYTPLRLAADNGHLEVMKLLLQHHARVNARDARNSTALHSAARSGDDEVVRLLLSNGADYEAKDETLMTAIHYACEGNEENHVTVVESLLAKKLDKILESPGKFSMSPLACACAAGNDKIVQLLLRKKASIKHRNNEGMTPLHWAAYNGRTEVVDILLGKRAAIDARTADGRTPLHLAVVGPSAMKFSTAELLIRKGGSYALEAHCHRGMQPLHYACEDPDEKLVALLLGAGAPIEVEAELRRRPLHIAAMKGSAAVVKLLLEKGAKTEVRDAGGDRPIGLASAYGHVDVVFCLLDHNVPMRAKFSNRGPSHEDSPLCLACKNGHADVVVELLARGASVRQRDEQNWQPLRYAAYFGHPEVVQYLLAHGATVSGLEPSGGWGFNMTAGRIGFAADVNEVNKGEVLRLLSMAEANENVAQESAAAQARQLNPVIQPLLAEKADDDPGASWAEKDNDREAEPTHPEQPLRPPPPPPQANPPFPPSTANNAAPETRESLPPGPYATVSPMPYESTSLSVPYESTLLSVPSEGNLLSAPHSSVSPVPTYTPSQSASFVSPLPPTESADTGAPTSQSIAPLNMSAGQAPGDLPAAVVAPDDIVACASCQSKGLNRPDMTCAPCRRVLFEYRYIMGQLSNRETMQEIYEIG